MQDNRMSGCLADLAIGLPARRPTVVRQAGSLAAESAKLANIRFCIPCGKLTINEHYSTEEGSTVALRIFVLADTHNRLPEKVKEIAKDADEIWHLGDVCAETILDELRAIGPRVTVVRGNCDSNFEWPLVIDLVRGGLKFRLQHVAPEKPPDDVDVLLHGHTHVPRNEIRVNVLFLNPGCVTRPNRGSPPSVAWLEIADGKIDWKMVPLR